MKTVAKESSNNLHKQSHHTAPTALKKSRMTYSGPPTPIVQRKLICPCDGGCPRCASVFQPKLIIGRPDDKYEQEADRVAEEIMRIPESAAQPKST